MSGAKIKRVELYFWAATPALITLGLFIVCMIPKHLWGVASVMPILPLIPVYYWGLQQAREMPYWFVCIVGLLTDATTGMMMGLSSLLYLLFLITLHIQRKHIHKEGFIIVWGAFGLLLAALCVLQFLLLSFGASQFHTIAPALLQWLFTVCCYPFFHASFGKLMEHIHLRRWKIIHA